METYSKSGEKLRKLSHLILVLGITACVICSLLILFTVGFDFLAILNIAIILLGTLISAAVLEGYSEIIILTTKNNLLLMKIAGECGEVKKVEKTQEEVPSMSVPVEEVQEPIEEDWKEAEKDFPEEKN